MTFNLNDDPDYRALMTIANSDAAKAMTRSTDKPKDHPWPAPFDEDDRDSAPELRCAVTGHVDADAVCGCAGCSAARVRGR